MINLLPLDATTTFSWYKKHLFNSSTIPYEMPCMLWPVDSGEAEQELMDEVATQQGDVPDLKGEPDPVNGGLKLPESAQKPIYCKKWILLYFVLIVIRALLAELQ